MGEIADPEEVVDQVMVHRPNLLLTAPVVPDRSMLPLVAEVRDRCPETRCVVLAEHADTRECEGFLAVGCRGYLLLQGLTPACLQGSLLAVMTGDVVVTSSEVFHAVLNASTDGTAGSLAIELPERSRRVLRQLALGQSREAIALSEQLSLRTVERIIRDLERMLDAPSAVALGVRAAQLRLVR